MHGNSFIILIISVFGVFLVGYVLKEQAVIIKQHYYATNLVVFYFFCIKKVKAFQSNKNGTEI